MKHNNEIMNKSCMLSTVPSKIKQYKSKILITPTTQQLLDWVCRDIELNPGPTELTRSRNAYTVCSKDVGFKLNSCILYHYRISKLHQCTNSKEMNLYNAFCLSSPFSIPVILKIERTSRWHAHPEPQSKRHRNETRFIFIF